MNLLLDKNTQLVDELRRLRARNNELEGLTEIEGSQLKERQIDARKRFVLWNCL